MTLANIRALFEVALNSQFGGYGVPVSWDNVNESPPANANNTWAQVTLTFTSMATPVLCLDESAMEEIRGTVQINIWGMRANGMRVLEELGGLTAKTLNEIKWTAYDDPNIKSAFCGSSDGPQSLLDDENPWAGVVVTAPFIARV